MEEKKKYYAYMLECADGTVYSGFTTDPVRRTAMHNSGSGAKYTRSRLPVKLIYTECFDDKCSALKREAALKKLTRREKLMLAEAFREKNDKEPDMAEVLVRCEQGILRGESTKGVNIFKGVPFAAPPVGPLRWRAPRKPVGWIGVRSADEFAPAPMQLAGNLREYCFSEDCLYLNIWAPADGKEDHPVLVWFYGGSYMAGRSDDPAFDGSHFASMGIVTVTVNYRVGIFGFMCHPEMKGERERGNFGFSDQIASLEWIRDNIAFFGGDPGNVTISGQSAGSASVNNLMVSPYSRDLFHKAINQSGDVLQPERDITFEEASKQGLQLQEILGCSGLDEMRELPTSAFQREDFDIGMKNRMGFTPVIDGTLIPRAQAKMLLTGDCARIPIMIGTCADEGSSGSGNYVERICERFSLPRDMYPDETRETVRHLARDYWYARHIAWIGIRAGVYHLPTWHYEFTHPTKGIGAQHGTEIPFIFGTLEKMTEINGTEYSEEEYRFMEVMSSYWANFIRSGDPNGEGLFPWPIKTDEPVHIRLDIPCSMESDIWRPEHEVIVPPVTAWLMARMEEAKKTE